MQRLSAGYARPALPTGVPPARPVPGQARRAEPTQIPHFVRDDRDFVRDDKDEAGPSRVILSETERSDVKSKDLCRLSATHSPDGRATARPVLGQARRG